MLPLSVRGHRMQICFNSDEELKPGEGLFPIADVKHWGSRVGTDQLVFPRAAIKFHD